MLTPADLTELGFVAGRSGINWTHGVYLSVTLYQDGVIDVRVEDVPLYGVHTRADVEALIRLLGEPRS